MFLTLGACKSQAGTGALHYPDQHHLEANVFWQLHLYLCETNCDICGTCECISPKDCTSTSQWRCHNYSCREFHTVLPMNWDYPKPGSLKY